MRLYEYRIEEVSVEDVKRDQAMTEALNKFGQEGWRVVSLEVEPRIASNEKRVKVLLERRASREKEAGRPAAAKAKPASKAPGKNARTGASRKQK
jgi:hypothetical protein